MVTLSVYGKIHGCHLMIILQILSHVVPGFEEAKVADLVNPVTRRWDIICCKLCFIKMKWN